MRKIKRRKRLNDLDKYLIYCIAFFTVFVAVELISSSITGTTHDTLINAVKWFCGGEVFLCAMIKRLKLKRENNDLEGGLEYDD